MKKTLTLFPVAKAIDDPNIVPDKINKSLFKEKYSTDPVPVYIGKKVHNESIYAAICSEWATKYPEKKPLYDKFFLKYRF